MPNHQQSRRQFLVGTAVAGLGALLQTGCGNREQAVVPTQVKAPTAPVAQPVTYTLSATEQKQLATHISNLRLAAPHDKQKALLLSAYTDPQVLDFLKNLAQGTGAHPTLFKNQFEGNPEFGKKVFAVIQDSLNQGLPAIGAVIVKLQQKAHADIKRLPAELKSAQQQLALATARYEAEAKTTNSFSQKSFNERRDAEALVRDITQKINIAPRGELVSFKVRTATLVTVDGDYGKRSENAMSAFSTRQHLLDSSFPHVKLDRRADTGVGQKTITALAYYNPPLALFLRCDEQTLSACAQGTPIRLQQASR